MQDIHRCNVCRHTNRMLGSNIFIPTLTGPSQIWFGSSLRIRNTPGLLLFVSAPRPAARLIFQLSGSPGTRRTNSLSLSDIQSCCFWNKALYFPIGYPHENSGSCVTNPDLLSGDKGKIGLPLRLSFRTLLPCRPYTVGRWTRRKEQISSAQMRKEKYIIQLIST